MAKPTGVWGIDIGQCALKALRLEAIDGQPTATAFDYIEHPKILSSVDADPDALTREALEKFLSRNPIRADQIAISIAGQSGLSRFVKLPPVEEKKVPEIVKFEAKQQIPFPLEEVVWAYQTIAGGESVGGFAMETEIGLFAMKRDLINRHLGHYQSVKAEVHYVQMAPLSLCNYATYDLLHKGGSGAAGEAANADIPKGKKLCAVVLDIGTDSSNLVITDGGKIIWQRPVPLGGSNFTRAVSKELKLTTAKAEHLKRNAAKSPDLATILKALRPVLTDFVGEVQRSLGYFTNTHRDAHIAYLVGLGSAFKLPGLQKYLSEKLSLQVRKPTKMERLSGQSVLTDPVFVENILTFPVAYGLALQGLSTLTGKDYARLTTNLLPEEIQTDRIIRAKKPWAAAAAACLVAGIGVVSWGYGAQLSAVQDEAIKQQIESGNRVVAQAKAQAAEQAAKKQAVETSTKDVAAIIAGNEERLNWARLFEVISAALPRPGQFDKDGNMVPGSSTNLELPEQRPFWTDNNSKRNQQAAYRLHLQRLAEGVPLEKFFDEDYSENLPMVNIEAIDSRYTENLQGFLTTAAKFAKDKTGLDITDDLLPGEKEEQDKKVVPKPPAGSGWIIEIRGYTYNSDATKFLRTCFVRNLQADRLEKLVDPFTNKPIVDNSKVTNIIPGAANPISGCISHVFLCVSDKPGEKFASSGFQIINNSKLDQLLAGVIDPMAPGGAIGAAGGAAPPPVAGVPLSSGPGGPTGPTSTNFKPLVRGSASVSGPGSRRGEGPGSMRDPYAAAYTPTGPALTTGGKITTKIPHEFIIYFIWREPSKDSASPAGSSAAPAAPPAATPHTP